MDAGRRHEVRLVGSSFSVPILRQTLHFEESEIADRHRGRLVGWSALVGEMPSVPAFAAPSLLVGLAARVRTAHMLWLHGSGGGLGSLA